MGIAVGISFSRSCLDKIELPYKLIFNLTDFRNHSQRRKHYFYNYTSMFQKLNCRRLTPKPRKRIKLHLFWFFHIKRTRKKGKSRHVNKKNIRIRKKKNKTTVQTLEETPKPHFNWLKKKFRNSETRKSSNQ